MTSFESSVARFSASLAAIDAAKTRVVTLDAISKPKQVGSVGETKKIVIRPSEPVAKPVAKPAAKPASERVMRNPIIMPETKPKAKKTSKLSKLVKGKKFDFS